jgi:hypothetical protein
VCAVFRPWPRERDRCEADERGARLTVIGVSAFVAGSDGFANPQIAGSAASGGGALDEDRMRNERVRGLPTVAASGTAARRTSAAQG